MPSREAEPFIRRIARSWRFDNLSTTEMTCTRVVALRAFASSDEKGFIYNLNEIS
jgi:hypothetical protein